MGHDAAFAHSSASITARRRVGADILYGAVLATPSAGSSGSDGIYAFQATTISPARGRGCIEAGDGNDVADGGGGNDVIHLDADPVATTAALLQADTTGTTSTRRRRNDAISGSAATAIEAAQGNDELTVGVHTGAPRHILGGPVMTPSGVATATATTWIVDLAATYSAPPTGGHRRGCEKRFVLPR